MSEKPSYILLGGAGFLGRSFAKYLVDKDLASVIRVVDKNNPITCFMNAEHMRLFKEQLVDFKQADLTKEDHVARVFDRPFTFVINFCAETRIGLFPESEYMLKCVQPALLCSQAALNMSPRPRMFVQFSTAQVYEPHSKPATESAKIKPWTVLARALHTAEERVMDAAEKGLTVCILRPAIVYGPGDVNGLSPRLCVASTYQHTGEQMKLLWSKDLKTHTVHVRDVCRAVQHVCEYPRDAAMRVFNLADSGDTDQGKSNAVLEELFGIKTGFAGTLMSNLAKLNFKEVCQDANEGHYPVWMALLRDSSITNSPLTTYISQELLYNNHLSVDGSAITAVGTGAGAKFTYEYPRLTVALVREQLAYAIEQGLFPRVRINGL